MINLDSNAYYQFPSEIELIKYIQEALNIAKKEHNLVFVFTDSAPQQNSIADDSTLIVDTPIEFEYTLNARTDEQEMEGIPAVTPRTMDVFRQAA